MGYAVLRFFTTMLAAAALVACGGGGAGGGGSSSGTNPSNTLPGVVTTARIVASSGAPGSPVTPYVSDTDLPKTYTFQVMSSPTSGLASVVGNQLVYTPNAAFTDGLDSFAYRATDSAGKTVDGTARVRVYTNTPPGSVGGLGRCTTASTVNGDGTLGVRINSMPCAFYGEAVTRVTPAGTPVTVRFTVHRPSSGGLPKAAMVLIPGGNLDAGLTGGDPVTGAITGTGGNFLVRSAQLYANAGYQAIVVDRPSDRATSAEINAYRISVDHAVDILAVLRHLNTDNLPLILVGTSAGAMSVVANNLIAAAIDVSSPVTRNFDPDPYLGKPGIPNLQATFVQRPGRVSWHQDDGCAASRPTDSLNLFNAVNAHLSSLGISASSYVASGGTPVTTASSAVTPNVCEALSYHGFLGIEPSVASAATNYFNGFLSALPRNTVPRAAYTTVQTAAGAAKQINLATLTSDADNDAMTYSLAHGTTSLGGSVALSGATATYTPPVATNSKADYFVYVVSDGHGGVRAAVVTVQIGS